MFKPKETSKHPFALAPGRCRVNHGVPEALERQNETSEEREGKVWLVREHEKVDPVDSRRYLETL